MPDKTPERHKLWLCDSCGQWAEQELGDECEVCCEGTIREVVCVPALVAERLAEAVKAYIAARGLLWTSEDKPTEAEAKRELSAALEAYEAS